MIFLSSLSLKFLPDYLIKTVIFRSGLRKGSFQVVYTIIISTSMSNFEEFKQTLSGDQLERFESRIAADREQYEKVSSLFNNVIEDQNSRLPYIPTFHRYKPLDAEQQYLEEVLPRIERARAEEFCLDACNKKGSSCLQSCTEFALKAFANGNSMFAASHKPYRFTNFVSTFEE